MKAALLPMNPSLYGCIMVLVFFRATTYFADRRRTQMASDACRKYFTGHPTLTPGVFTVFCQHGICYGFEVSHQCVCGVDFIHSFCFSSSVELR